MWTRVKHMDTYSGDRQGNGRRRELDLRRWRRKFLPQSMRMCRRGHEHASRRMRGRCIQTVQRTVDHLEEKVALREQSSAPTNHEEQRYVINQSVSRACCRCEYHMPHGSIDIISLVVTMDETLHTIEVTWKGLNVKEARSKWWKQHDACNNATTTNPKNKMIDCEPTLRSFTLNPSTSDS